MEKCPLCFSPYRKPKLLPCLDTVCFACLDEYVVKQSWNQPTTSDAQFPCPVCAAELALPEGGITKFPDNQHVRGEQALAMLETMQVPCEICDEKLDASCRCIECEQNFCKTCSRAHLRLNIAKTHTLVDIRGPAGQRHLTSVAYCNKHKTEEMTFFCRTCLEPVCMRCRLTTHEDHTTEDLGDFASSTRRELRLSLDEEKGHRFRMLNEIDELRAYADKLTHSKSKIKKDIKQRRKQFHDAVDKICNNLLGRLDREVAFEKNRVEEDRDQLEEDMLNFSNKVATANQMVDFGSDTDIVTSRGSILATLRSARKDVPLSMTGVKLNLEFSCQRQAENSLRYLLGRLSTDIIPPSYIKVMEVSTFRVNDTSDVINSICPSPDGKCWIACGWKPDIVLYDRSGQKSRVKSVGRDVDCLAIDGDGNSYVSCRDEQAVKRFDRNFRRRIASLHIQYPRGIATTSDGKLVICVNESTTYFDYQLHHRNKVLKLGPDGDESKELQNPSLCFKYPIRVAVNVNDELCVSDNLKHMVMFLKPNGEMRAFYTGDRGSTDIALVRTTSPRASMMASKSAKTSTPWAGHYSRPEQDGLPSITPKSILDRTRTPNNSPLSRKASANKALAPINVNLSNEGTMNSSVTLESDATTDGADKPAHLKALTGLSGGMETASVTNVESEAEFMDTLPPFDPRGITCDRYGHVIVADYSSNMIHLLDKHGRFLMYLLTEADGIFGPTSVAVDTAGFLWVGGGDATVKIYNYIDAEFCV